MSLRQIYVLFFIDLERRKVFLAGVTEHPIGSWVTQQARNLAAVLEDERRAVKFLIRGSRHEVRRSLRRSDDLDRCTRDQYAGPSTAANAFAERFVRTVRIECLDWLLVRNERHLERVLVEFVDHYNEARPHRGIDLEVPAPYTSKALFDDTSRITRVDRLGGLIREYSIAA